MIRGSILFSTTFHAAVVAAAWVGLPTIRKPPPAAEIPIVVELVMIAAKTNIPAAKPEPAKVEPKEKAKPKPKPKKEVKAPPPPPPAAKPDEVAALTPPPKPKPAAKPKPIPKPKPKPEVKAKPKPKIPRRLAKVKPRRKPPPPDPFASVLRSVEKIRKIPRPVSKPDKAAKKQTPREKDFAQRIAAALARPPARPARSDRLTLSERDAIFNIIRRQIEPCWIIPAGAKDAQNLSIEIRVALNPDGRVRFAGIKDRARMIKDPFFKAAAESALRAVQNPKCGPFKLPPDKYHIWQDLTLNFDPSRLF